MARVVSEVYMSLIMIILTLAFVGFLVWLILQIPMPQLAKNIILGFVCFVMVVWILQVLGVHTGLPRISLK